MMKSNCKVISCILLFFLLGTWLGIRDYRKYFYGESILNYHVLPYHLTPSLFEGATSKDGKTVPYHSFSMIFNDSEYLGPGSSVPVATDTPEFIIRKIIGYYYNEDEILILCVDTRNQKHIIKPIIKDMEVDFEVVFSNKVKNLATFKFVDVG